MLTAALTVLALLLLVALGAVCLLWRAAVLDVRALEVLARHQCERIDGYRAELDALSLAGPTVYAALAPDAEPPVPAAWLDDLHTLPTTYDREYPR